LADQAYAAIRAAITSGELPAGEKITERGLAAMLSVSLTPVREAIRRLEQELLIERRGARATVVFERSPAADDEFVQLEAALRALAVRLATTKADEHLVARLEQRLAVTDELRELAARTSGAGPARALLSATVPLLRPAALNAGVIGFALSLEVVGLPLLLGTSADIDFIATCLLDNWVNTYPSRHGLVALPAGGHARSAELRVAGRDAPRSGVRVRPAARRRSC
jgi:DNA-binding transcriptional regulator YhcF (GntR family)